MKFLKQNPSISIRVIVSEGKSLYRQYGIEICLGPVAKGLAVPFITSLWGTNNKMEEKITHSLP